MALSNVITHQCITWKFDFCNINAHHVSLMICDKGEWVIVLITFALSYNVPYYNMAFPFTRAIF